MHNLASDSRPFTKSRLIRPVLILAWVGILASRLAFALTLPGPWYLPDEVRYLQHARRVASSGEVFYQSAESGVQPGWPVLLAPIMRVLRDRPYPSYVAGVVLATTLGTLVIFPVFFIARRWLPPGEAVAVAILTGVMPGACLYGWALLTEPLYTLFLVCCAAWFVRAAHTERAADFAISGMLAGWAYWVRPFGLACVLACIVGSTIWGIGKKRWREPVWTALAASAVVGAQILSMAAEAGQVSVTNYGPSEAALIEFWWKIVLRPSQWLTVAIPAVRDVGYLVVASFAVSLPLTLVALGRGIRQFRRIDDGAKSILAAGGVLFGLTFALVAFAQSGQIELERMYGRYVEPLMPLVVLIGAVTWHYTSASATARRNLLLLVVALVLILALSLPQGEISFTNNPGFWWWHLAYGRLGAFAAMAVLVGIAGAFVLMHQRRLLATMFLVLLASVSTTLVASHVWRYNEHTRAIRETANQACEAVKRTVPSSANAILWADPNLFAGSPALAGRWHHFTWWLQYGLPTVEVRWAQQDQTARVSDLILTRAPAPEMSLVWELGGLRIYRIERPTEAKPTSPPPDAISEKCEGPGP